MSVTSCVLALLLALSLTVFSDALPIARRFSRSLREQKPNEVEVSAAVGACNNTQDLAVFAATKTTFKASMTACATGCFGDANCTATCISKKVGLTTACGGCFGTDAHCTLANCVLQCLDPNSQSCVACSLKYCEGPLVTCAGVPQSVLPNVVPSKPKEH